MGVRSKCFCGDALFPSNDVDTKGGTFQPGSWYRELCTALITTENDSVLQASKDFVSSETAMCWHLSCHK